MVLMAFLVLAEMVEAAVAVAAVVPLLAAMAAVEQSFFTTNF
jgi:hypothetical protein